MSAKHYNPKAQFHLGVMYSRGEYVKKDLNKAIHYYKEASSFNDAKAKNNLAMIYRHGIGVEKNIWYSIELLKEAIKIEKLDILAIYNLFHIFIYENLKDDYFNQIFNSLIIITGVFGFSFYLLVFLLIRENRTITIEMLENKFSSALNKKAAHKLAKKVFHKIVKD